MACPSNTPRAPHSADAGAVQDAQAAPRPGADTTATAQTPPPTPEALHAGSIVIDLHADTLWQLTKKKYPFDKGPPESQLDPKRMRQGGLDAQFFSLWLHPRTPKPQSAALKMISLFDKAIVEDSPDIRRAHSAGEIERFNKEGKLAALLGLEGGLALEGNPDALRQFHTLGVRYMSLTWNPSNPFGDGAKGSEHGGATAKGLRLVRLMNTLGVMVDISHASEPTFWDVIAASRRPVIATHSNARALCDHPRNLDDAQLWAIAASNGLVGLNFHSSFLTSTGRASMKDVLAHAAHIRQVIGARHLALGSDFDGNIRAPEGLEDVTRLPDLSANLREVGFSDDDIRQLLGENVLRVLRATQGGPSAQRVRYRPARIDKVEATVGAKSAALATDRSTRTAWQFGGGGRGTLRLEVQGPGVERVSLCAASPGIPSNVRKVLVTARSADGTLKDGAEVDLTGRVRPHPVALPGVSEAKRVIIEIEVTEIASEGKAQLSEVIPEVKAAPR